MCIHRYHPLITGTLALLPELGDPISDDDLDGWVELLRLNVRALYKRQADIAAREAELGHPLITGSSHDDLRRWAWAQHQDRRGVTGEELLAEARAVELERQNHPTADELEAESRRPVPPPPAAPIPPASSPPRLLHDGGDYDRAGRFRRTVLCTFELPTGRCNQPCAGTVGMQAHLSQAHAMRGTEHTEPRKALIEQAVLDQIAARETAALQATVADVVELHPAPITDDNVVDDFDDDEEPEPEPEPRPTLEEQAAAGSPGSQRLLEIKRQALTRLEPTTDVHDRHALADELGVAFLTVQRWWQDAYPEPETADDAAILDGPTAATRRTEP